MRIYFHRLGTDPATDIEIFGQGYGPDQWIFAWLSDSGRYLLIYVGHGWARSDLFFQDRETWGPIRPLTEDIEAQFQAAFAGDRLVVQTDWRAPNQRLLAVDPERPERENWREIAP